MNSDVSINEKGNSGFTTCNIFDLLSNLLSIAAKLLAKLHNIFVLDGLHTLAYIKPEAKFAELLPFVQSYALLPLWHTLILLKNPPSFTPSKPSSFSIVKGTLDLPNTSIDISSII